MDFQTQYERAFRKLILVLLRVYRGRSKEIEMLLASDFTICRKSIC